MKSTPKDVFLHLLSILALYISASSLITLFFQYINILFPDKLQPLYYSGVADLIRYAMASLIIVFPVFVFVSWTLNNDYNAEPEKRGLKIRRWLVHFTLFVAAAIIVGDLVVLVYNFLGGDLTARFILKVLSFLSVAGAVFIFYLLDLRDKLSSSVLKILVWAVPAIILASIVAGFFTAGSPFKARLYRFDEQRVSDLQMIQNEIINYWIQKEELPGDFGDLKNSITGFMAPADPETNIVYGYNIKGKLVFELCANFNLDSTEVLRVPEEAIPYKGAYGQNWDYKKGNTCFARAIDPELYKDTVKVMR